MPVEYGVQNRGRDSWFLSYGSVGPLVSCDKIRYFAAIGLCSVKTVVDRHRHAAHHNKHW